MTTSVSISPVGIQFFLNNSGAPNAGGTVLTQVGGINHATYQDSAGATPLPNPIPLNSRGEISNAAGTSCQLFLETGVTYTFTVYDANGNQLNQATYVAPPVIATQNSPFTENTISTSQSLGLANSGQVYICTAALTLTIAQSTLLNKAWFNIIFAEGGDVTITPNGADAINGGSIGASYTIVSGNTGQIYTDGAGNIYVTKTTTVTNATSATASLSSGIPQNSKSAAYTTVLGDANYHILHPTADNNARTFTIDSNANVPYPIGTTLTFVNQINTLTIAITSDTLTLAGVGSTGSRTLNASGMATALKVSATNWVITGSGIT